MPRDLAPGRLQAHFKDTDFSEHGSRWDSLWKDSFTPWDRGSPSMALNDVLAERKELFPSSPGSASGKRRTALVPGCGRGYDVLLLSALGYDAYGLDTSESAINEAKEVQSKVGGDEVYHAREGVEKGHITWLTGNFFKDEFLATTNVDKFDLIYDYTFFCALPPSARPAWAKRMSELLAADGRLVCLEFPSTKPTNAGGPPYGLPPSMYIAHLSHPGKELPYDADGAVAADNIGPPAADALKRLVHFHPARSHKAGYDDEGNVDDCVSVWGHSA